MSQIKFGTDGWRAIISEDFTFENVRVVAQAIADYLIKQKGKDACIVLGYDTRFMSDVYAKLIAEVLAGNYISVLMTDHPVATPTLSYNVCFYEKHAGIMVTASHNPAQFNGIKIKENYGGPAEPEVTAQIEANLFKTKVKTLDIKDAKDCGLVKLVDMEKSYQQKILDYVDIDLIKKSNFKILIDSMYGAGLTFLEDLLKGGSCQIKTIHGQLNPGFGGIAPEPIYHNLKELIQQCKGVYDIGFATDGDADRIGVVDSSGSFIFCHEIISVLMVYLKKSRKWSGGVAKSLSTTALIDRIASKMDIPVYETPVGFKYICELMRKQDILIGGEESGGIGFKNHIPERDSFLSALLLLEMMARYGKGLIEILKEIRSQYGHFHYDRIDIHYEHSQMPKIQEIMKHPKQGQIAGKQIVDVKTFDGLKYIFSDASWLLIRASGTEPILRIYAESENKALVPELLNAGKKMFFDK